MYGLFSARCKSSAENFSKEKSAYFLPRTNPFLRKAFNQIVGPDLDPEADWIVDSLVDVLKRTRTEVILEEFSKKRGNSDPMLDFYEGFLKSYNPSLREERGVYYTPRPVVNYIVNSINLILKNQFKVVDGLSDNSKVKIKRNNEEKDVHKVIVLDPAVGTGTFLHEVINNIKQNLKSKNGLWSGYVDNDLLPRIFGFEVLMAPYTIAHMKLSLLLDELNYISKNDNRLNIFLTNTLSGIPHDAVSDTHLAEWLINESNEASTVKKESPVMVILGNPPYSAESQNESTWIYNLLRGKDTETNEKTGNYFAVNDQPLNEKNPRWLNDDYVKFIRYAQRKIERTGYGVIGFITPHGFLDNNTFRGMRASLLNDFDEIYILNCHGNIRKKELCPDGSKDEGLFDIQQGVCISFFIRNEGHANKKAKVYYHDLYGLRMPKYNWLSENDIQSTKWQEIIPKEPSFYFIPVQSDMDDEYDEFMSIDDIFNKNSVGIVTARDKFTICWSMKETWEKINDFIAMKPEEARRQFKLGEDSRDWKVSMAQGDIKASGPDKDKIMQISYRPFDVRYTYYTGKSRGFICMPRADIMDNIVDLKNNISLVVTKETKGDDYHHAYITQNIAESTILSSKTSCIAYVFPSYISLSSNKIDDMLNYEHTNISVQFIKAIETYAGLSFNHERNGNLVTEFGVDDCIGYIYAILNSNEYKRRYNYRLKRSFPKIPTKVSKEIFVNLAKIGASLINAHLMSQPTSNNTPFPVSGACSVDKILYDKISKIFINKKQYFDNVSPEVWGYKIGSYNVCEKWLKSRKDKVLSNEELKKFSRVIDSISSAIIICKQIDHVISKLGGFPFNMNQDVQSRDNIKMQNGINEGGSPFDKVLDKRLAIASYIIDRLKNDATLNRKKFVKVFYLIDRMQRHDLKTKYLKAVAGPLDSRALYNPEIGIEALAKKHEYFVASEEKNGKNFEIKYSPGKNLQQAVEKAKIILGDDLQIVEQTIAKLEKLNSRRSEVVATLYACWNNLILKNKRHPTDDELIASFFEWSTEKKDKVQGATQIKNAIAWMKKNNLVPLGKKPIIDDKI